MSAKIFSVDIEVFATAYIKAENEKEAKKIVEEQIAQSFISARDNRPFDERTYDCLADDESHTWSLSPEMTIASMKYMEEDLVFDVVHDPSDR